jgi:predicted lipopolysaccharide heptosyltransferase III
MKIANILVIKLRHIGDVLLATPVFTSLRQAYPDAKLSILVNRGTEDILVHHPGIDELIIAEKGSIGAQLRFLGILRRKRFDCVVDLTDGDRSAWISVVTGSPLRIGFNAEHRWRGLLYSHVAKPLAADVHRVEYDLAALRPLGLTPRSTRPTLYVSRDDEVVAEQTLRHLDVGRNGSSRMIIVIQPGARYPLKVWPPERFAELADRLAKAFNCRILLGGDKKERDVAESVSRQAACKPTIIAGRLTLLEFAALLKHCALFVGSDGGAMHIAAAVDVPVVALFGPTYPQRWGPRGRLSEVLYKGLDCRACYHPTCIRGEENCMRMISVDEVFESCNRLLQVVKSGTSR